MGVNNGVLEVLGWWCGVGGGFFVSGILIMEDEDMVFFVSGILIMSDKDMVFLLVGY